MALPAGVTYVTNIKGEQGNKGDTGSLAFITAESVPAGQPASAEMIGPPEHRGAHVKLPRGLPGLNAVPTDEAIATLLNTYDSDTRQQANKDFPSGLAGGSDGSALAGVEAGQTVTVVCHGHSNFYGQGGDEALPPINDMTVDRSTNNPVDAMTSVLALYSPHWTVINRTRAGGSTQTHINNGFVDTEEHGDIHMFWFDSNYDREMAPEQLAENWALILSTCAKRGCQPVIIGGALAQSQANTMSRRNRHMVARAAARRFGAVWVNTGDLMKDLYPLAGRWTDGIHLTDDAFAVIGVRLAAILGAEGFEPQQVSAGSTISPRQGTILGGAFTTASRASAEDEATISIPAGATAVIPVKAVGGVRPIIRFYTFNTGNLGVGTGRVRYALSKVDVPDIPIEVTMSQRSQDAGQMNATGVQGHRLNEGYDLIFVSCDSGQLEIERIDFVGATRQDEGNRVQPVKGMAGLTLGDTADSNTVDSFTAMESTICPAGRAWEVVFDVVMEAPSPGAASNAISVGLARVIRDNKSIGVTSVREGIFLRRDDGSKHLRLRELFTASSNNTSLVGEPFVLDEAWEGRIGFVSDGVTVRVLLDGVQYGDPVVSPGASFTPAVYASGGVLVTVRGASYRIWE